MDKHVLMRQWQLMPNFIRSVFALICLYLKSCCFHKKNLIEPESQTMQRSNYLIVQTQVIFLAPISKYRQALVCI